VTLSFFIGGVLGWNRVYCLVKLRFSLLPGYLLLRRYIKAIISLMTKVSDG